MLNDFCRALPPGAADHRRAPAVMSCWKKPGLIHCTSPGVLDEVSFIDFVISIQTSPPFVSSCQDVSSQEFDVSQYLYVRVQFVACTASPLVKFLA